ncbi:serine/threonine-protein kinase [Psychromonas antarctica]|uniref:serine/threonine-protein kinase n=1 Tax=Psychromonas antarctica TaxID=67573 RepID=UPI001EE7DA5C|nr:serine/threonine-protein kinase [Psychromonas antarctica]MCG6201235.1 serine/threonine protein kinase [Psychromonas antarctica]
MEKKQTSNTSGDKTVIATKGNPPSAKDKIVNLIGTCFNKRYLIESQIGTGGMSDVYRAVDLHLQKAGIDEPFVAIKVLQTQFSGIEDVKKILIKEALKTQKLSHPNIIRVFDVDTDGEYDFMVMEWLDGESLDQIINSSKPMGISFTKTKTIIKQIANALSYAHKNGLIHTDLKPSNIFLTRKGEIKVFDFGVAHSLQLNYDKYAVQDKNTTSALTGHTPAYASLEQLNGELPCESDDIFAFSCIIYELLSSKHPYQRIAANKINTSKTKLNKPKNMSYYHWLTLKKGLALQKNNRISNISDLISGLCKNLYPKIAASIAIMFVFYAMSKTYLEQNKEITDLNNKVSVYEQYSSKVANYLTLTTSDFLSEINIIETEAPLITQALLRKHQQEFIDIVEQKIKNAPTAGKGKFKNIDAVNAILAEGLNYYPDSLRLRKIQNEQNTSRLSIITALIDSLDQLLIQGRYQEQGAYTIPNLLSDLALLVPDEEYFATAEAFELYENKFNKALDSRNYKELNTLIEIGELVFHNNEDAQSILQKSKQMAYAVTEFSKYTEALKKQPNSAIFPYEAAAIFYQRDIDKLSEQLSLVNNYQNLIVLDKKIDKFSKLFPLDFKPLLALQKLEASTCFSYANVMMDKRAFAKAKGLITRGNELLESLEKAELLATNY